VRTASSCRRGFGKDSSIINSDSFAQPFGSSCAALRNGMLNQLIWCHPECTEVDQEIGIAAFHLSPKTTAL
jgi:hypothetical protein